MNAISKFALTAVSFTALVASLKLPCAAASARHCQYVLGTATWPSGRTQALEVLDQQALSFLSAKGYTLTGMSEAGLVLSVTSREASLGWIHGTLATVRLTEPGARADVAAEGDFAVGAQLELLSAINRLPNCL